MNTKEIIEKYGEVALRFRSYYKYTFTYEGEAPDGTLIIASYGDSDIYRDSFSEEEPLRDLMLGEYSQVEIKQ